MQTKHNIGDNILVPFKVAEITIGDYGTVYRLNGPQETEIMIREDSLKEKDDE